MKKFVISALAVVALGATVVGAKTARAEAWVSSGWQYFPGHYTGVSIPNGFTTTVDINNATAPNATRSVSTTGRVTNSSFTNSTGNCTGTAGHFTCPTTHWAFTLCSDNTFITGPLALGAAGTVSNTHSPPSAPWAARWTSTWGPAGDVTGLCSDLTGAIMSAGGVWMYQYGP